MFDRFLVPFPRPLLLFHFHRQPAWKTPQFFRSENCGSKIAVNADMFSHISKIWCIGKQLKKSHHESLQFFYHHESLLKGHWIIGFTKSGNIWRTASFLQKNNGPWKKDVFLDPTFLKALVALQPLNSSAICHCDLGCFSNPSGLGGKVLLY